MNDLGGISEFLVRGGPAMWLIAALSVATLALVLWKLWRLSLIGAWRRGAAAEALALWEAGDAEAALAALAGRTGLRATLSRAAMTARRDEGFTDAQAREETTRIARRQIDRARAGLRPLDLIATIAPLIGLFGTVLGMIEAFQALQEAGNRADPAALAGGIWQALLTTAAGMAVAIPASMALSWFEAVADGVQADLEDIATRIFTRGPRA